MLERACNGVSTGKIELTGSYVEVEVSTDVVTNAGPTLWPANLRWGRKNRNNAGRYFADLQNTPSAMPEQEQQRPTSPAPDDVTADQKTSSDEVLMQAFARGEAACFDILVRRHQDAVLNFILRTIRQRARAEELLQEVFIRVVKARGRYEVTAKFTTWLYTIARNICFDELRRGRLRQTQSLDTPGPHAAQDAAPWVERVPDAQPDPESKAHDASVAARIQTALNDLPDDQREVFILRQLSGLAFKEIGEIVGVSENTVKSRMRYALEKVRQALADIAPGQIDRANTKSSTAREQEYG